MSERNAHGMRLFDHHASLLNASAISVEVAGVRGYVTVETRAELTRRGFGRSRLIVPGLLIPLWNVWGSLQGYLELAGRQGPPIGAGG